ncbi:MAG: trehalose-6-phosphate synthase [Alphaproteobacteria bacterium]
MSRIVCISNRVSLPDPKTGKIKAGGLAVGVQAALKSAGGGLWFGWDGNINNDAHYKNRALQNTIQDDVSFITLSLTKKEYENYYKGMANQNLWPLMHQLGNHLEPKPHFYETYKSVNKIFAHNIVNYLRPDDIIWVHDYHLMPLGKELRQLNVRNKIAFYNHIPVPAPAFVQSAVVPSFLQDQYKELLDDLFYYDQIGFQSYRDYQNFSDNFVPNALPPKRYQTAAINGSAARFGVFPISIETQNLQRAIHENGKKQHKNSATIKSYKTLIGAERLDYTKGLWHRMEGYYKFLKDHKEFRKHVQYKQVAPLSRADIVQYKNTINKTRKAVRKIKQRFSSRDWDAIDYSEKNMARERLLVQMRKADIALVTPLIDGQNLVAKEYLAVQSKLNPGILILSRYAGAAEELESLGVLCVDPENIEDIANKIYAALQLSFNERRDIHDKCLSHLKRYDIANWSDSFLHELQTKTRKG